MLSTSALIAAGGVALLAFMQVNGVTDGTFPLFHLGAPYGYSVASLPSLRGKVALVTGASSGLGLGVARALALQEARLIVTARDEAKCEATLAALRAHAPAADVSCVQLELLSLERVRAAADELAALPVLDLLVLNAGIMAPQKLRVSADGFEEQFQVNHLSQFYLLQRLLGPLQQSAAPRAVLVSSVAHYLSPKAPLLTRDALNDGAAYSPFLWYGWTKLCNILTARELSRRHPKIVAHAVHPGGVQGKLLRYSGLPDGFVRVFERAFYWDIDRAALTVLRPLLAPDFAEPAGRYLVPIGRARRTTAKAEDAALAREVWERSEALMRE